MLAPFGDLTQIVTLGQPTPELIGDPNISPKLARLCNDGMRQFAIAGRKYFRHSLRLYRWTISRRHSRSLIARLVKLGACGIQVLTNISGKPLDAPEFFPIFEQNHRMCTDYRFGCIPIDRRPSRITRQKRARNTRSTLF